MIPSENELRLASKQNSQFIIHNWSKLNKIYKNLDPLLRACIRYLKLESVQMNRMLVGGEKTTIGIWTAGYACFLMLCAASVSYNYNKLEDALWQQPEIKQLAWNMVANAKQPFGDVDEYGKVVGITADKTNGLALLYILRECIHLFLEVPRYNNNSTWFIHGGSPLPSSPETVLRKAFLSCDYRPHKDTIYTSRNKHLIYVPSDGKIPIIWTDSQIHNSGESEVLLPPGVFLEYKEIKTEGKTKVGIATVCIKDEMIYFTYKCGTTSNKIVKDYYVAVNWYTSVCIDNLPTSRPPIDKDEYLNHLNYIVPYLQTIPCDKKPVLQGNPVEYFFSLVKNIM